MRIFKLFKKIFNKVLTHLKPDDINIAPLGDNALSEAAVHSAKAWIQDLAPGPCHSRLVLSHGARMDHRDVKVHRCHLVALTLSGAEQEVRGGDDRPHPFHQSQQERQGRYCDHGNRKRGQEKRSSRGRK